jgi:hypothetical protein
MTRRVSGGGFWALWASPLSDAVTSADEMAGTVVDCLDSAVFLVAIGSEAVPGAVGGATLGAEKATANARRLPIRHKAKLVKTRGLKKADLDAGFFFMSGFLCLWVDN